MNLGQISSADTSATDAGILAAIGPDFTSYDITTADLTGGTAPAAPAGQASLWDQFFGPSTASQDVTTPVVATSAPQPSIDPSVLNSLVSFAGQVYRYVQTQNAQGQIIYQPQPVSALNQLFSKPVFLIGIALAAVLLLK